MINLIKNSHFGKFALATLVVSSLFSIGSAEAEEDLIRSAEFINSCASCHGVDAKGDGDLAKHLKVAPADLTVLAKNNDGEYPFLKVFHIIDGRTVTSGHGERSMPVWGDRYSIETGDKYGPFGGETAVRARILELVYYIQNMQGK